MKLSARAKLLNLASALFVMTTLSIASVSAQEGKCALKLADLPTAPALVGFHLGMTKEEVKTRVPQVVFGRTDGFGVSKTTINPDFDPKIDKASFAGARTVSLDFLDDRLTSLWIGYGPTFKARTVEALVDTITKSLSLPAAWSTWRLRGQQMRCADFQIWIQQISEGPSLRIVDSNAADTIAARREAKLEEEEEAAAAASSEAQREVLGDKKSKVYYPFGCSPAKAILESDRVVFANAAEAEQAGFKVAANCSRPEPASEVIRRNHRESRQPLNTW